MKLLLDQNLSHRIVKSLVDVYPGSAQVSVVELDTATDKVIWEYAKSHDYTIVTLDADFHEYSMLQGGPPLIIWLKCGNQPKHVILEKLLEHSEILKKAHQDPEIWCVEIY